MLGAAQSLSDDPVILQGLITQLTEQLTEQLAEAQRARAEHAQRIEQLLDYIALLQRKRFGPSADRIPDRQLALFDEAELETLIAELEAQLPAATPPTEPTGTGGSTTPQRQPVRRPLPANLPRAAQIIPKSIAHHSLLASIITGKFVDGLPLTPKSRSLPARGSHSAAKPWPGCSPNCTPHSHCCPVANSALPSARSS